MMLRAAALCLPLLLLGAIGNVRADEETGAPRAKPERVNTGTQLPAAAARPGCSNPVKERAASCIPQPAYLQLHTRPALVPQPECCGDVCSRRIRLWRLLIPGW